MQGLIEGERRMFDERAFIARVEAADAEGLANILARPSIDEEKALRAHFGDERYQRMHGMALKRKISRSLISRPKGNVVVIHGLLGGELTVSSGGPGDLTWVNAFRIVRGWLDRLKLDEDGRAEANSKFKVFASNIMKRHYGEMLLSLSQNWNVKAFWFDWRKDIDIAADELNMQISTWFGKSAPVHIIGHSLGGLVARTFIKRYAERWASMWDKEGKGRAGGRLLMLGTPNHGSFAIPQVITGIEGTIKKLSLLDLRHDTRGLLDTFNTFPGSYQLLPSTLVLPAMKPLYDAVTYGGFNVPQRHLDNALKHHQFLSDVIDTQRMIYVAGYDYPTFSNIKSWKRLDSLDSYEMTLDGDGRVTHELGLLKRKDGPPVRTYFIKEEHGNLSSSAKILGCLDELLETGETDDLFADLAKARSATRGVREKLAVNPRRQYEEEQGAEEAGLLFSMGRMGARSVDAVSIADSDADSELARGIEETPAPQFVSPEERKVEETITRGFLAYRGDEATGEEELEDQDASIESARIEIGLAYGGIESVDYENLLSAGGHPVDAVAVGHYVGVQPQGAELMLDRAISKALRGRESDHSFIPEKADLIITQYTERGLIQGKLGQPFFLPDPRPQKGLGGASTNRIIAIAGMDEPGRFGMPELTVLARELCWSLGRMNKLHLATVLIGAGEGNLSIREAVSAWMSGIRRAVAGSAHDDGRKLLRVTFVEYDPRKITLLDQLILQEKERRNRTQGGFEILYEKLSEKQLRLIKRDELNAARRDWKNKWKTLEEKHPDDRQDVPTRVTLGLDVAQKSYRFGAITDIASVPEREIKLDPTVVMRANDELAGEQRPAMQLERGRFLEALLMPPDLRKQLYTRAPLVMLLDSTTARIHWEMVAQPALTDRPDSAQATEGAAPGFEYAEDFLGTSRGFTRQLRTAFAPPPEPPPPPRRILRVLVVADPAEDAHLPGAQEEGSAVADLFESYNTVYQESLSDTRVEVKRLFGPLEATRTNVLRELMVRSYDVLHFAGHCVFQWDGDPALSGWIFNAKRRELLSANELNRIDRIPKFVFSNACESGITPDRSQERNVNLAPSFAEAFFARGVANFVCTAWPVDDLAARTFALTLYAGLLGMNAGLSLERPTRSDAGAIPMHEAMKVARLTIASTPSGRTTWGAYQHYGNPYFRLFYSNAQSQNQNGDTHSRKKAVKSPARRKPKRPARSAEKGSKRK
jgi:hypothetical protein